MEYDYGYGAMASFPWKYQFLFTQEGKLVAILSALNFSILKIFPNQNPFLLTLNSTAKGNGGHKLYKISADTLENVYEGYNDFAVKTYDVYEDNVVYEPNELILSIKDIDKDGYNDIIFHGKLVLIQGLTKDSLWYDNEVREGKDTIKYSINHPYKKLQIQYAFLYNKETGHFVLSDKYSKKYSFN